MKKLYTILLAFHLALAVNAQSVVSNQIAPKHEVRAVWLTTIGGIDWPHSYAQSKTSIEKQQKELRGILDQLQVAGINTVLLQTRVRGTMIYPSAYEPWDGCLSGFPGRPPGYDALKYAIDECHKRGMELHAWVVTIPVGKWNALGCKTLRQKYPTLIKKIGADGYMNPEDGRTANYLATLCREITHNYDIDGIHLDYIRYPETWNGRINREQGRKYITQIVTKIHDAVKTEKPWVKMSCSPVGKFDDLSRYWSHGWNAYTKVCQDAQGWLRDGLMDELFPMMYFREEQFFPFAIDWQERNYGKIVVPGLGIYFLDPKEGKWNIKDVTSEMYHLRNLQMGYAFFRNKFFLDNKQGIYDFTTQFNAHPALVPPMTWACNKRPAQPANLTVTKQKGITTIAWQNKKQYEDGSNVSTPYIYNNVYASRTYPVDITDARNLISARNMQAQLSLKAENDDRPLYFAVTSMDRYGTESLPTQENSPKTGFSQGHYGAARMLKTEGNILYLENIEDFVLGEQVEIKTAQDVTFSTFPIRNKKVNISSLQAGTYLVYSIKKRDIKHCLGRFTKNFFQKK